MHTTFPKFRNGLFSNLRRPYSVKGLFFVLFLATSFGFSTKVSGQSKSTVTYAYQRSGMVNFIGQEENILTVSSRQKAENLEKAIFFAEINALENILYRGIPGSIQKEPMVPDEREAKQNHAAFLQELTQGEGYRTFMIESTLEHRVGKRGNMTVTQWVTFDLSALRKHLEKNGIIRKFGF